MSELRSGWKQREGPQKRQRAIEVDVMEESWVKKDKELKAKSKMAKGGKDEREARRD